LTSTLDLNLAINRYYRLHIRAVHLVEELRESAILHLSAHFIPVKFLWLEFLLAVIIIWNPILRIFVIS
jgi:hypothetical protein